MSQNIPIADQLRAVFTQLGPHLTYLERLRERLDACCGSNHELTVAASAAYNAVYSLRVTVHYASCENVGKPKQTDGHEPML